MNENNNKNKIKSHRKTSAGLKYKLKSRCSWGTGKNKIKKLKETIKIKNKM
jgi:hypothetical protein